MLQYRTSVELESTFTFYKECCFSLNYEVVPAMQYIDKISYNNGK